jgi:hypothetical protein
MSPPLSPLLQYIEENVNEMTDGFIAFVQKELKGSDDTDSKVVIASLLQLIGQVRILVSCRVGVRARVRVRVRFRSPRCCSSSDRYIDGS